MGSWVGVLGRDRCRPVFSVTSHQVPFFRRIMWSMEVRTPVSQFPEDDPTGAEHFEGTGVLHRILCRLLLRLGPLSGDSQSHVDPVSSG